jgi:predicted transcriptional regulator
MTIQDPPLSHVHVSEAMHTGILTTDPSTPLTVVARLMADQRIHAVAVADPDHVRRPLGFVTVDEVIAAAAEGIIETAGQAAATEVVTVSSAERLDAAAQLMAEHSIDHLVVVDAATGHPCGILSGLDVAAAYARS